MWRSATKLSGCIVLLAFLVCCWVLFGDGAGRLGYSAFPLMLRRWVQPISKPSRIPLGEGNNTLDLLQKASNTLGQLQKYAIASIQRIRVLCWVMTGPATIKTKSVAVLETWGKHCDKLLFMTSEADQFNIEGRVSLAGVGEGRDALVDKSREAWRYVHGKYRNSYDWFYKCDDDTFTVVENLKFMVSAMDTKQPALLGKHLRGAPREDWVSGGAGYVLNRLALDLLANKISQGCLKNRTGGSEDQVVSHCLRSAGVSIGNSLDTQGRSRILPLTPDLHLKSGAIAQSRYKWVLIYSTGKDKENAGDDCCSDLAISFHYISPAAQHALYYLVYKLHKFGDWPSDLQLIRSPIS